MKFQKYLYAGMEPCCRHILAASYSVKTWPTSLWAAAVSPTPGGAVETVEWPI